MRKNFERIFDAPVQSNKAMKAKLIIFSAIASLSFATPTIAKSRVVETKPNGRAVVTSTGKHWRNHYRDSGVNWGIGVGFGSPFYSGYYGGYPGYYGAYPYGYTSYYPYGTGYGYGAGYYRAGYPYYGARGYTHSIVARVQSRLARGGYYAGPIDGVIGPRTRYAIRVYEARLAGRRTYRHSAPSYDGPGLANRNSALWGCRRVVAKAARRQFLTRRVEHDLFIVEFK